MNDSLELMKHTLGVANFSALKDAYSNENMNNIVTNHYNLHKIILDRSNRALLQTVDPIYLDPKSIRFLDTPLYSKYKYFFGYKISTFKMNLIVLWLFTVLAFVALYFDRLKKTLEFTKNLKRKP